VITKVSIKNFRSIDFADIPFGEITTFVGRNDAGKSNILRALNLFFNGRTDPETPFLFIRDFNRFAETPAKKAKEISIGVTIRLPDSYRRDGYPDEIFWKKVWRSDGYQRDMESQTYIDWQDFPPRSRIRAWAEKIIFEYVPAIKDKEFFIDLQGKVYDVLASVAEADLRSSASAFEQHIQDHLANLTQDVSGTFHDSSLITLPANLRHIFEKLEFASSGIPLSLRGDGIKVRHIPMILKFLADKRNSLANSIKHTHIWGIEEPENNVEMVSCFEMAKQFSDYAAQGIQAVISTHSPVFYTQAAIGGGDCFRYLVAKSGQMSFVREVAQDIVDSNMGLMPVVAPHILREKEKWSARIAVLEGHMDELKKQVGGRIPYIFCEGETDKIIIEKVIDVFMKEYKQRVRIECGNGSAYGSASAAASRLIAWQLTQKHQRNPVRGAAIFDYDDAGKAAKKEVEVGINGCRNIHVKVFYHKHNDTAKIMKKKGYSPRVDLEFLYPDTMWLRARDNNFLKQISDPRNIMTSDKFFKVMERPENMFLDLAECDKLRLLNVITEGGKITLAREISLMRARTASEVLKNFEETVRDVLRYLFLE